jgi:hypothetical protein
MSPLDIILLSLAGLLSLFLYARHWRRLQHWPEERQWTGTPFDAARVHPRIQHLRQDYLAELHRCPQQTGRRRALVASARLKLAALPCFKRDSNSEDAEPSG